MRPEKVDTVIISGYSVTYLRNPGYRDKGRITKGIFRLKMRWLISLPLMQHHIIQPAATRSICQSVFLASLASVMNDKKSEQRTT
jgi:hypothetical protein